MTVRIAINGFGRIGRNILRAALEAPHGDLDFVAVNDLTDAATLAHLFKYDSVHRRFQGTVSVDGTDLIIADERVRVLSERDPSALPWGELGIDVVIEGTGLFRSRDAAAKHLQAGARKVIITAPAKDPDVTVVLGVNADQYDPERHDVISNASCTTNCIAPVVKVLLDEFGFECGLMTTVHSYTNDQRLLDLQHKDLRRARAAAMSIIPTSTGAAKAVGLVLPDVQGKLDGMAMRVPTPDVSIVDLVATLATDTSEDEVNAAFRGAADGALAGILEYTDEPLVSVDFTGHPASSIVDGLSTSVIGGRLVKVISWYDNEWGYSNRCIDLARFVGDRLQSSSTG
jgi:glyceraldehyde 3-phosphate dehydrogenase